ncbi:MAG: CPBP family intramembrane metalloprotease [Candidatus Lokiarchaeota archaeon]|nr:CPBP family intramembrane metalloprotease [Candidatus Lokiarchaeota archaeon]
MENGNPPIITKDFEMYEPVLIRNPWLGVILVMVFYFLFQLIPQVILGLVVQPIFFVLYPYVPRIIEFISLGILLLVLIPFVFRIPNNNQSYVEYMKDIKVSTTNVKAIFVGLITIAVVFVLGYGAVYLSAVLSKIYLVEWRGYSELIPIEPKVNWDPTYLLDPYASMNIYYALTPGIMEELAFRGIILSLLLKKYKTKTAVVIDGVLFGLYHLLNLLFPTIYYLSGVEGWTRTLYFATVQSVAFQVVYATSLGIAWALLFVKSNSIISCILGHYLIDALGNLVLIPTIAYSWIYFISITILGIGILPAIIDILIINVFYRKKATSQYPTYSI